MQHMDIAYSQLGITETAGPNATPAILRYFAAIGRADVVSDETAWCAAFAGWVLKEAGVDASSVPASKALLARSYLAVGTPIDVARVGALAIFKRDEAGPHAGHVGFVTGTTATHIVVLGGNQKNAVTISAYPRDDLLGLRWVGAEVTAPQLAAAGSRTVVAAGDVEKDGAKAGGVTVGGQVIPPPPPGLGKSVEAAMSWKGVWGQAEALAVFGWKQAPFIAGALAAYWCARMAYRAWQIRQFRVEDHNTGAHQGRATGDAA